MEIDKMLNPFGPITYTCDLFGRLYATQVEFTEHEALKLFCFRHAREVRMRVCRHDLLPIYKCRFADLTHRQRLNFCPLAMQQRHERAIDTQHELIWSCLNFWPVLLNSLDLSQLHGFIGHPN